ncbi:hypothetical protein F2P81_012202 [Scophthalmus maximus]|uniref:Uncharacterized protein n=1 Tax=Scophthalmus maximus TaxID=52904 RepID=A0A6A4STS3_SCOMX|nr:hypothetical protein F2P81_012202 [Scophthalmus maximus]
MKVSVNRLDSSTEPWQVMAPNDPTCIRVTATNQTHVCLRLYANSQLLPVRTMQSVIKVDELQFVRDQLFFSGLSSEVQLLPPDRTGPELQRAAGFRSEGAVWFSGESTLSTGDSEVVELQFVRDQLFFSGLRVSRSWGRNGGPSESPGLASSSVFLWVDESDFRRQEVEPGAMRRQGRINFTV